ncbi:hypothetical protein PRUPE_1G296700 [Prunus persica]|uniref:Uncharacterized protein n=2 Tax=Prunus persica TaxID=3760 RepID=A0A251R545_PRUPE|nr:hypothetical protein PRUPE_1G296700 [Prunus persica]
MTEKAFFGSEAMMTTVARLGVTIACGEGILRSMAKQSENQCRWNRSSSPVVNKGQRSWSPVDSGRLATGWWWQVAGGRRREPDGGGWWQEFSGGGQRQESDGGGQRPESSGGGQLRYSNGGGRRC